MESLLQVNKLEPVKFSTIFSSKQASRRQDGNNATQQKSFSATFNLATQCRKQNYKEWNTRYNKNLEQTRTIASPFLLVYVL